jgi:O-antigen/teichoic acid export membrane protein
VTAGATKRASYREGVSFGALSFGVMATLGVVSSIVIARMYGVRVLGEFALVMAPANAVWYLSSTRERTAFVRELATQDPRAPRVTGLFSAMLAFSLVLTIAVDAIGIVITYLLFTGPIGQPNLFVPALANMGSYVLLTNTGWNLDAVFSGFRAGRELFWIRLHQSAGFLALAIGAGIVWGGVWGLVLAAAGSAVTALIHRVVAVRRFMRPLVPRADIRDGFRTLPDMIRFGLKILPGSLANGVSNEAGTWTIGVTGSVVGVGAFNRAWTLGRRFIEVNWRITEMLFPTLVERREARDMEGFDRALVDTIRYCAVATLLPAAAGGGAAAAVMELFGADFVRAADALSLILLMPALLIVTSVERYALFAVDRPIVTSAISIARMVVTLGTTVLFTIWLGITGAALGLLAGALIDVVMMSAVTRRHLSRPVHVLWPPREMLVLVLAYGAGFGAARLVDSSVEGLFGLAPALVVGGLAFTGVFWLAGGVNPRDRERLASVTAGVRKRRQLKIAARRRVESTYAS